jgi:hypothetical protein
MTEDEAKKKWCPLAKPTVSLEHIILPTGRKLEQREDGKILVEDHCIGSACMAWRWNPLMADDQFKNAIIKAAAEIEDKSENKMKATKHVMANRSKYGLPTEPFDGYCGLSGKP